MHLLVLAMNATILLILKYVTSAITVGTAFAGTWFFEFTKTDKDTGRRSLTPWGRRAIVFAATSLACAAFLTVWVDRDAAQKQQAAERKSLAQQRQIEVERGEATAYRERSERSQVDIERLL